MQLRCNVVGTESIRLCVFIKGADHHANDADLGGIGQPTTGDVKKGSATVGHALMDRALYLPRCLTDDAERRTAAGVPADIEFTTKPALAQSMISAALDAGVPAAWVAGDEV